MARTKKLASQISIRLEDELKTALEEMAQADDRSLSSMINRILRRYIDAARGKRPDAAPEPALPELIELAPVKKKPAKKRA
jgi:hypothetical protein